MSEPNLKAKSRRVACVATLTAAGLSFGLVACGGDSSTAEVAGASSGQQPTAQTMSGGQPQGVPPAGAGGPPLQLTAKQEECLAGEGVALPQPGETSGQMPDREEVTAAFEACDTELPEPPSGSAPAIESQAS